MGLPQIVTKDCPCCPQEMSDSPQVLLELPPGIVDVIGLRVCSDQCQGVRQPSERRGRVRVGHAWREHHMAGGDGETAVVRWAAGGVADRVARRVRGREQLLMEVHEERCQRGLGGRVLTKVRRIRY